jgi:mannose-6-phosphate isomerase-like protein (cupin superfamily)
MAAQLFLLKDFINPDEKFHMARVKIRSRQDLLLHRHDFSEIFWVENGKGTHLINGRRIKIRQGGSTHDSP